MLIGRAIDDIVGHDDAVHIGMINELDKIGESAAILIDAEDGSVRIRSAGKG